jgi:hypothetical protein
VEEEGRTRGGKIGLKTHHIVISSFCSSPFRMILVDSTADPSINHTVVTSMDSP